MHCTECGNELRERVVVCPSCGCATRRIQSKSSASSSNRGVAAPGLILSLVTLVVMLSRQIPADDEAMQAGFLLVATLSIVACLLSGFAYAKIASSGSTAGRVMSMIGIAMGCVCLLISLYVLLR